MPQHWCTRCCSIGIVENTLRIYNFKTLLKGQLARYGHIFCLKRPYEPTLSAGLNQSCIICCHQTGPLHSQSYNTTVLSANWANSQCNYDHKYSFYFVNFQCKIFKLNYQLIYMGTFGFLVSCLDWKSHSSQKSLSFSFLSFSIDLCNFKDF